MRLLYLDWPHLPLRIEAARTSLPELVIIGGHPWEQGTVLDCSPAAVRLGVRRGQPLGSAHKLAPEAHFLPTDGSAYRQTMEAALDVLAAFTPSLEAETDFQSAHFGRVLLGIEGLQRLWGDEPTLARRVLAAVRPVLPGSPRIGIGNTRFGAQVAAITGDGLSIIPAGDAATEAAYLAPLPISLLPADEVARERLRIFGLARVGEFAALSRSAVLARFGQQGGLLHDLARGLDHRQLRPRRPLERLRAEAEIDPPVGEIEPLRFVLRHLCGALCEQLAARGAGCAQAIVELGLDHAPAVSFEQSLPEPVAAAELLERLLLARLLADPPQAPVNRLALELRGTAPAAGQQLGLLVPQLARAARFDWQLAGLAIRFGADRLLRARVMDPESALAERRIEWRRATDDPLSPAPAR
jgi:nucleotidyltransferase/DNA polymerase involved in DNA repair